MLKLKAMGVDSSYSTGATRRMWDSHGGGTTRPDQLTSAILGDPASGRAGCTMIRGTGCGDKGAGGLEARGSRADRSREAFN